MKNKKIIMYLVIILLILFFLAIGWLVIKNHNNKKEPIKEFIPEEEITTDQLRRTNITLYFINKDSGELTTEIRQIDSKILLENPEIKLIEFLISGPLDNNLENTIPGGTKLISAEKIKGILYINFSEEFIDEQFLGGDKESKIIESILKTVTQINEIEGIKILINGEENKQFPDGELNFKDSFRREAN